MVAIHEIRRYRAAVCTLGELGRQGGAVSATEPTEGVSWRKAEASGVADCVEVAAAPPGVWLRNSKRPEERQLAVPPAPWKTFLTAARDGLPTA